MATGAEVKLFGWKYSPFTHMVMVAMTEKGIPYETVLVDMKNKPKELLEANPVHGKVPTIIHRGKPVPESLIIMQYLDDMWPEKGPCLPKDAFEKSRVLFWTHYIHQISTKIVDLVLCPTSPDREASKEALVKGLRTIDESMTAFSADGPFFTGDRFGYLDVVMAPLTNSLLVVNKLYGVSVPGPDEIPRFWKWLDVTSAHPSVRAAMPTAEETIKFFTMSFFSKRTVPAAADVQSVSALQNVDLVHT